MSAQSRTTNGYTKSTPLCPEPTDEQISEVTDTIRTGVRQLRGDDVASFAQQRQEQFGPLIDARVQWFKSSVRNGRIFFGYVVGSWNDVLKSCINPKLDFDDRLSVVAFAFGATVILGLIWIWCFISTAPLVVWLYSRIAGPPTGGLGLVNGMNPKIFHNLTQDQFDKGREKLAAHPKPDPHNPGVFDLGIAKLLLQISALMYERSSGDAANAIRFVQKNLVDKGVGPSSKPLKSFSQDEPGDVLKRLVGSANADNVGDDLTAIGQQSRDQIERWTNRFSICFEPVSELASLSQAFCSIFWDPTSTWLIVAFKGTDPRSFEEWTTDFTAMYRNLSKHIKGFKNGHHGFKERMFPENLDGKRGPWDTISATIKLVCEELTKYRPEGTLCDVWFTGHSLGTAIATLGYAKALIANDIGPKARLRDAYLFATPITVDMISRQAFNEAMYAERDFPRTMWRVTNRNDFVATGLPALGDSDKFDLGPDNLFGFSHLGIEIFMKSGPVPCQVQGNKVRLDEEDKDYKVVIASAFTPDEVRAQRTLAVENGWVASKLYLALQYLPIVGRLAAHGTVNYYDQLDQIAIEGCVDRR